MQDPHDQKSRWITEWMISYSVHIHLQSVESTWQFVTRTMVLLSAMVLKWASMVTNSEELEESVDLDSGRDKREEEDLEGCDESCVYR